MLKSSKNLAERKCLILQGIQFYTDVLKSRKTATLTTRSLIGTISVLPEDYKRAKGRKKSRTREKRNKRIKMASFYFSYTENFCARADDRNHISRLFISLHHHCDHGVKAKPLSGSALTCDLQPYSHTTMDCKTSNVTYYM